MLRMEPGRAPEEVVARLVDVAKAWTGGREMTDDVTPSCSEQQPTFRQQPPDQARQMEDDG